MKTNWRIIADPVRAIFSKYWQQSRWMLALVALVVFLAAITSIAGPYVFSRLIDQLPNDFVLQTLLLGFVAYAVLVGISTALNKGVQYMSLVLAENLGFIASTRFFARLIKKTVTFFIDHNPAEIQNAQQKGEQALQIFIQLGIIVFVPGITQITFTLLVLGAVINIEIVAIVVVYGTAFIVFTYFANKWTHKFLDRGIEASQENARFVGNSINAMETLRQFGSDKWIMQRFADKAAEVRDSWRQFALYRIGYAAIYGTALAAQLTVTYFVLLPRYGAGELSVGDIVLFNALLLQLNQPFEMIGHAIDDVVRSYTEFLPFAKMWAAPEDPEPNQQSALTLENGRLSFENVSFAYGNGRNVADISFSAQRGQVTFLVGETGSGKSTIFKLALKSLEPDSGHIEIDGTDLSNVARSDWFALVGVVPQDIALLNESLTSNIVLGRPHDPEQLRRVAERASILNFIEALPDGFDTNVGERGLRLSGGERQRIAIARALYANPKMLFLDEASAALDEATEDDIMSGLRALQDDITIVAITHRKSVIHSGDHVVDINAAADKA